VEYQTLEVDQVTTVLILYLAQLLLRLAVVQHRQTVTLVDQVEVERITQVVVVEQEQLIKDMLVVTLEGTLKQAAEVGGLVL
jgi:hypothetical protein